MSNSITIKKFLSAVRNLPSDDPVADPAKWYRTQKEHWIGWLDEYASSGVYNRKTNTPRDARYAYNHIVEPRMLLWLIEAAGTEMSSLIPTARNLCFLPGSSPIPEHRIRRWTAQGYPGLPHLSSVTRLAVTLRRLRRQFQPRHVVAHFALHHSLVGAMLRRRHAKSAPVDNGLGALGFAPAERPTSMEISVTGCSLAQSRRAKASSWAM